MDSRMDNITLRRRLQLKIQRRRFFKLHLRLLLGMMNIFGDIGSYFAHNTKRFSSIAAVFLFFIISSSFAFPYLQEDTALQEEETESYVPTVLDLATNSIPEVEVAADDTPQEYDSDGQAQDEDSFSLDEILEANEYSSTETVEMDADTQLTADDWRLILVNKQNPIPDDYTFTTGTIIGSMKCDIRILDDLMDMLSGAKEDGINLQVRSPYRTHARQVTLFNNKIDLYMSQGYSYMEAYKISCITVNVPGTSEHEIGLALDITCDTYPYLKIAFGETEAGQWLAAHCSEYGFIIRYPEGKEYVTGVQYEPWHVRYVGKEAAKIIMEEGITLEEFVEDLSD